MKTKTILVSLVFLCALVAVTFAADSPNPNMGTWKLNEAKSKFAAGATKNTTVVYSAAPNDMIKVVVDGTDKDGKAVHNEWTGKFDGKDYPATGDPNYDSRSYKMAGPNTLEMTVKKAGKVVGTGTIVISADGKSRTVTTKASDPSMAMMNNTAVYEKQ
jgi:hypothetical protein